MLASHQDIETRGCGGLLALHRDQRDPVKVVFVTDGADGDPDGHYLREDYVRIRQSEARRATRAPGVADRNLLLSRPRLRA